MMATLDQSKAAAFGERMVAAVDTAALVLMMSIGHRTRLFDVFAKLETATSDELAKAAGLNERYVREWLGAMVTGGVVEYDDRARHYCFPAEHAASLTRSAAPNNAAAFAQWIPLLGAVEENVVEAFAHGRGVPYSAYDRFHEVMAEESAQTVVAGLEEHILPLVPGLVDRLRKGIDVLDVGCGVGRAMNYLAAKFPNSRFTGHDFSEEAIARASDDARAGGLSNVRFEVVDAAQLDASQRFDLVTAFDAIHDQARPQLVLANIAKAIRRDGVFLMQDIKASSCVHNNVGHPVGTFIYTVSCMHCMSVSLACGGAGLGAAWGKEKALTMLAEAGFKSVQVEELPHDIVNYFYVARL
jgi:2-polyprenyl-3-methyl-5-hydroxy-6-metoxy-1,4-benzoquinol methylase